MDITDLVEYSLSHLSILRKAKALGLDLTHLIDPRDESEHSISEVDYWFDMELHAIPKQLLIKDGVKVSLLGYSKSDFAKLYMGSITPPLDSTILRDVKDYGWRVVSTLSSLENIDVETFYKIKESLEEIKRDRSAMERYLPRLRVEMDITGRIDMCIDSNYSILERCFIVDIYDDVGIDVRYIKDFDVKATYKELIDDDYESKVDTFQDYMIERYTPEELALYRKISNKFREDRLEYGHTELSRR